MGETSGVYRVLEGRPEGKRPLGRPRRRWEDIIKIDLQDVGYWGKDWIELAQDRDRWRALVNAVMNLWGSIRVGNFLTSSGTVSFPGRTLFLAAEVTAQLHLQTVHNCVSLSVSSQAWNRSVEDSSVRCPIECAVRKAGRNLQRISNKQLHTRSGQNRANSSHSAQYF